MATSHFCKGKWKDGPSAACPHHTKLPKAQTNVYRGIGDPGGRAGSAPPGGGESSTSSTSDSG